MERDEGRHMSARVDRRSFLTRLGAVGTAGLALAVPWAGSAIAGAGRIRRGDPASGEGAASGGSGSRDGSERSGGPAGAERAPTQEIAELEKSKEEWRRILEPDRYRILFEEETERPFTSPLNDEGRAGTFVCAACFLPLFSSEAKYDSGTGWPSFWRPIEGRVGTKLDFKLILPRTEYHCIRCGGHQGHRFKDGPPPTGLRYCNNGLALRFVPEGEELPELRT